MPTAEQPTIIRGNFEGRGKNKSWEENEHGSLLKIIFGETEYNGKTKEKTVTFGREKGRAILSAVEEIKEFVNS